MERAILFIRQFHLYFGNLVDRNFMPRVLNILPKSGYQYNPESDEDNMLVISFQRFQFENRILLPEQEAMYEYIAESVKKKKVLEYGCGIGIGSNIIFQKAPIIATDNRDLHINFARCLYPNVDFRLLDIKEKINIPGIDVAIAIEVIEHVENAHMALENMLRNASEIFFSTPNLNNSMLGRMKPKNLFHVREYTPEEICKMFPDNHVEILHPLDFSELEIDTDVTPVLYHVSC